MSKTYLRKTIAIQTIVQKLYYIYTRGYNRTWHSLCRSKVMHFHINIWTLPWKPQMDTRKKNHTLYHTKTSIFQWHLWCYRQILHVILSKTQRQCRFCSASNFPTTLLEQRREKKWSLKTSQLYCEATDDDIDTRIHYDISNRGLLTRISDYLLGSS